MKKIKKLFAVAAVLGLMLGSGISMSVNADANHELDDVTPPTVTVPLG
jgi:hypothetical protein